MLLAAALVAPMLTACDNGDLPPATKYSQLHGTVIDAATRQPIANASIVVDTVLTATTAADGTFTIDKVPSGIVDYVVKADGYKDLNSSGNAEPGKPFELTAELTQPTPP